MRVFSKDKASKDIVVLDEQKQETPRVPSPPVHINKRKKETDSVEEELSDIILQYSIKQGYCDVVALLLQKCKTVDLNKTLLNACKNNSKDVIPVLMEFGATDLQKSLEMACEHNNIESVKLVIERQIHLWKDDEDESVKRKFVNKGLARACIKGSTELVALLLEQGADDLIRGMYIAVDNKNQAVVTQLRKLPTESWLECSINRYGFDQLD